MKIIKSFLIVAVAMGASTVLHAQEQQLKAEVAKPAATTVPPPGSKPPLAPDMKPQPVNTEPLTQSEQTAVAAPLPSTRKEVPAKTQPIKPTGFITDEKLVITQPVMLPNDQNAKPVINTSPAAPKGNQ